jgi:predicted RNA-binding protein with PIN domain
MPYLIDGHNLIPKLGLHLDSPDDEEDLLRELQEFSRLRRMQVEVFFDQAPAGLAGTRKVGMLTVHSVRAGSSADAAIEARLTGLGRQARNWTVVSSDGRIQRAAQAVHARMQSSEELAGEISRLRAAAAREVKQEPKLDTQELDDWLELFGRRRG